MVTNETNLMYFYHINSIGGVETWYNEIAKKYGNIDITIYYTYGDYAQICRLAKTFKIKKYNDGDTIICKKAFFNMNTNIIDHVIADEYIQIIHTDVKALSSNLQLNDKITKYIGVSQLVCDNFKELTGKDIELCYNPLTISEQPRVLRLISATRLTKEKGKERIKQLANALDNANIPYIWTIFTNDKDSIENPNVIYMQPRLDIEPFIADSDYLVQLSDSESYCYSVNIALALGVPVIVTNCPIYKELGIKDREHGFILDMNMLDIPVEDIYNSHLKIEYELKQDHWLDYLYNKENEYKANDIKLLVKCVRQGGYDDFTLNEFIPQNKIFTMDYEHAILLSKDNIVEIKDVIIN